MAKVTLVEICKKYGSENSRHVLPEKDRITLGRDENNDIVINHSAFGGLISRNHCIFVRKGDELRVFDNNSRNGTFVGQKRVGKEGEDIYNKSYLYLGSYALQVEISPYSSIKERFGGIKSKFYNMLAGR